MCLTWRYLFSEEKLSKTESKGEGSWKGNRQEWIRGPVQMKEGLGRVEGEETAVGMYYMREEQIKKNTYTFTNMIPQPWRPVPGTAPGEQKECLRVTGT